MLRASHVVVMNNFARVFTPHYQNRLIGIIYWQVLWPCDTNYKYNITISSKRFFNAGN